jgi:hypothetical protein
VSERPSPLDALVDLAVYAPVGIALTLAEELPGLVAKGRSRLEPQLGTARLVGQFVVAEGRRRVARFASPVGSSPGSSEDPRDSDLGGGEDPVAHTTAGPAAATPPARPPSAVRPGASSAHVGPAGPPPATAAGAPASGDTPSPDGLAIPGYDSLSASQVVQRLAGLSSPELAAVGDYEAATRGRRTILARVSQLQGT